MATQKITLKRVIDSNQNTDVLYPTTTLDQIFTVDGDGDITETNLSTYLGNTYVAQSTLGANSGVATLDSSGTLTPGQIPSSLIGGMKFKGTIDLSADDVNGDDLASAGMGSLGDYLIVSSAGKLTNTGSSVVTSVSFQTSGGDEGDQNIATSDIEAGDWLVLTAKTSSAYTLAVVNNTYEDATTAAKGIVQLSAATDTTGSTNEVITESVLASMIGTTANKIAAGNHNHDTVYEPKRATSGTAYNKDFGTGNTDVARGNHDHDDDYLALSGGTLTGDLVMQYDGDTSANRASHGIQFQAYSTAGEGGAVTRYLSIDETGYDLQFGSNLARKRVYVLESTSLGRTFYNTTSGAEEGDFIIDVD